MTKLTNNELISGFNKKYTAWEAKKNGPGTFEVSKDKRFKVIKGNRAEKKHQKISYLKVLKTIEKETGIRPKGLSNNISKLQTALKTEDDKHWKVTKFFIKLFHKITGYGFCTKSEYAAKILSQLSKTSPKTNSKNEKDPAKLPENPAKTKKGASKKAKRPKVEVKSMGEFAYLISNSIDQFNKPLELNDILPFKLNKSDFSSATSKVFIKINDKAEEHIEQHMRELIRFIKNTKQPENVILMVTPNETNKKYLEKNEATFSKIGGITWEINHQNIDYLPDNSKKLPSLCVFNADTPIEDLPKNAWKPQTSILNSFDISPDSWKTLKNKGQNLAFSTSFEKGKPKYAFEGLKNLYIKKLEDNILNLDIDKCQDLEELYCSLSTTQNFKLTEDESIDLTNLTRLKNLTFLTLDFKTKRQNLPDLSKLKKLNYFTAEECSQDFELSNLKELKSANFAMNDPDNNFTVKISDCPSLDTLILEDVNSVEGLSNCPSLKNLIIEKTPSKKLIDKIPQFKNLETLKISNTDQLKDFKFNQLKKLQSFEGKEFGPELDFSDSKNLKVINITEQSTEQEWVNVKGCSSLESLNLQNVNEIKGLSSCKNLKALSLDSTHKDVITNLPSLEKLEILNIHGVDNLSTLDLSKFPNLKCLRLTGYTGNHGDIENLKDLSCLPKLEILETWNLSRSNEPTVGGLEKLKHLKEINLQGEHVALDPTKGPLSKSLKYCNFTSTQFNAPISFQKGTQLDEFSLYNVNLPKESSIPPCKAIEFNQVKCPKVKLSQDVDFFRAIESSFKGKDLSQMKNLKNLQLLGVELQDNPKELLEEHASLENLVVEQSVYPLPNDIKLPKCKNLTLYSFNTPNLSHPEAVKHFTFKGNAFDTKTFPPKILASMENLESCTLENCEIEAKEAGDETLKLSEKLKKLHLIQTTMEPVLTLNEKTKIKLDGYDWDSDNNKYLNQTI